MSTASWMHFAEGRGAGVGVGVGVGVGTGAGAGGAVGAVTGTGAKFEDAMAEFRANGRDSDDGRCAKVEVPNAASSPLVPMSPCSMCGICPSLDAVASKEIGAVSSPSVSPDVESSDLQQQFGAGLKKLLVDKPNLRADSSWPFLRRDFPQMSSAAPGGLESIWQLGAGQYPRPNLAAPLGGINFQLQRLQQLRQKKTGFVECVFCRNNGEQASFYRSHELKDQLGRVICPVLRAFTCPCCGATGDNAHTIKYCPERGTEFIPGLAQLKVLRMANSKRRINIPRRFTGSQELGPWFNQE